MECGAGNIDECMLSCLHFDVGDASYTPRAPRMCELGKRCCLSVAKYSVRIPGRNTACCRFLMSRGWWYARTHEASLLLVGSFSGASELSTRVRQHGKGVEEGAGWCDVRCYLVLIMCAMGMVEPADQQRRVHEGELCFDQHASACG